MGVTTANCFVCGQSTTVQFSFPRKGKSKAQLLGEWRKKWSMSLCHVLQLSDSFQSIFNEASFCFNCQEAVCRAEFTVNTISRLQKEIGVIREELKGNFQSHYENLMQGRTELDATGNEYKSTEDIIKEIAIKVEPVEENVDHCLDVDNLDDREIVVPRMNQGDEDEFSRLELLDPLDNSLKSLESHIPLSSDLDNSVVLPIPSISKLSSMRQRQNLVSRSGRIIKSRVNCWETSGNSSDSGNDFEDHGDPDFNGTEMAEDDKEIGESKPSNGKRKSPRMVQFTCNFEECVGKNLFFGRRRDMRAHLTEKHEGQSMENPYHCPQCQLRFNRVEILERHALKRHIDRNQTLCTKCDKKLNSLEDFQLHQKNCGGKEQLPKKSFIKNSAPKPKPETIAPDRYRDHARGNKYSRKAKLILTCNHESCREHNLKFKFGREVREHILNVHNGVGESRLFHCAQCPRQFNRPVNLRNHINLVHFKASSSCTECTSDFKFPRGCPHQAQKHKTIEDYLCVICGKLFRTQKNLKQHERVVHNELQMKPKCSHCRKSFEGTAEVEEHETLHSKETPFRCVLCNKMLNTTFELQRHVAASHELWAFECPTEGCTAKFALKSALQCHQNQQHRPKRHACPHCPFRFYAPSGLKSHMFVHTGEKPINCSVAGCTRKFSKKSRLLQHVRTRHEEVHKRFECRICRKCFQTKSVLKRHEIYHGDARPFMCDICSATFKTKRNLDTHSKVHTKMSGTNLKLQMPRKARIPQIHTRLQM